jgi:hypothetical protein
MIIVSSRHSLKEASSKVEEYGQVLKESCDMIEKQKAALSLLDENMRNATKALQVL